MERAKQTIGGKNEVMEILFNRKKDFYAGEFEDVWFTVNPSGSKCYYVIEGNHVYINFNVKRDEEAWYALDVNAKAMPRRTSLKLARELTRRTNEFPGKYRFAI